MEVSEPFEYSCPEIADLATRAFYEFSDVADYIWKSIRFIKHETELELRKLDLYFPEGGENAAIRWKHESRKLGSVFPYLIATGNLYGATCLFEVYLLLLAEVLQQHSHHRLDSVKGQGTRKLFEYLKLFGIRVSSVPLYEQVYAAIRIRNCLVHAGGLLESSRDRTELQRIQISGAYLSPEHRTSRSSRSRTFDEVSIVDGVLGKKIEIDNQYSHLVVSYFQDYIIGVCRLADSAIGCTQGD